MILKRTAMLGIVLGAALTGTAVLPAFADETLTPAGIKDFQAQSLIKADGTYWEWGGNHPAPTQVPGLNEVAASFENGLVVKEDQSVWHWEYKNATTVVVEEIPSLHQLCQVLDIGNALIALEQGGNVYTIPRNEEGKLNWNMITAVDKLKDVSAISSYYTEPQGKMMLLFLKKDGSLWSSDENLQSINPVKTAGNVKSINGNYVLLADGTVQVFPAMGNASWATVTPPTILPLKDIQLIKTNRISNAAVDGQHRLWFWGNTLTGVSDGTVLHEHKTPVMLNGIRNVKEVFLVERSFVVLTHDGKVYGTSLDGESLPANAKFSLLASDIREVAAGGRHIIMQTNTGALWGWGINKLAEQGTGDYEYMHHMPVPMQPPVTVVLNGQPVALNNGVIIRHSQAFVPIRSVFEQLGAKVDWDVNSKTVTISKSGTTAADAVTIKIQFPQGTTMVNGKASVFDTAPFNLSATSYLPLRFISESLGAKVEWIKEDNRIAITK